MTMKKLLLALCAAAALLSGPAVAQRAIIAGEQSAGVYVNIKTDASGNLFTTDGAASAVFTNTAPTITNSSTVAIAANTSRKYLTIQNNDASGNIFCTPVAVATTTNGVKILPAQMWAPSVVTTSAINCIGSIASNANVIVTEGQ